MVPIYWHGLTLIAAGMNNYMANDVWGDITYPFPKVNGSMLNG